MAITLPAAGAENWDVPLNAALQDLQNQATANANAIPTASTLSGATSVGKAVMTATDAAAARSAIGAAATGSGGSGASYPGATAYVYASSFPYPGTAGAYVFVCDGTNDEVEINNAITAVAGNGGGKVQLVGTGFNISGSILMKTGIWLNGGGLGCIIKAASGFGAGMIQLFDNTVHATKLSDLTLDGNSQAVTAGVYYSLTGGQVFTSSPSTNPDPGNIIDSLYITQVGTSTVAGHGMRIAGPNNRAGKYANIRILGASGCGVWVDGAVDSHYSNIEIGSSGSGGPAYSITATAPVGHGFFVSQGDNNMFVNCKAWYSRGAGFYNRGSRNGYVNCQAQDNYSYGFQGYYGKASYVGCQADSNGQALGANGLGTSGFYISSDSNIVSGCMGYDRGGQAWVQQYGFQFSSGMVNSRVVGCVTYGNAAGSVTGTAGTGSTTDVAADANGK